MSLSTDNLGASAPTTIAEAWEQYAQRLARDTPDRTRVLARRGFYSGAFEALFLMRAGKTHEALLAECVQFGRAIGTPAESAN